MEITTEIVDALFWSDDYEDYKFIELTPWRDDGKYSWCDIIFKFKDKFYSTPVQRVGGYHSGYEYDYYPSDCYEVELKEFTVKKWVNVPTKQV